MARNDGARARIEASGGPAGPRRLSLAVARLASVALLAVLLAATSTGLWSFLPGPRLRARRTALEQEARSLADLFRLRLDGNRDFLVLLSRAVADAAPGDDPFQAQAPTWVASRPELLNATRVDASYLVRDVTPLEGNAQILGLRLTLPEPARASAAAVSGRRPAYTGPFEAIQGRPSFEVWVPVLRGDELRGLLAGVYSCDRFLSALVPGHLRRSVRVSLRGPGGATLSSLGGPREVEPGLRVDLPLSPPGEGLVLVLEAGPEPGLPPLARLLVLLCILLAAGIAVLLGLLARDALGRRRAEEGLRDERDLSLRIAETSPVAITRVDADGRIVYANRRAEEILGLTRSRIEERAFDAPAWSICALDGGPFPIEELPVRRVLAEGKPVFDVRHAIVRPDGDRRLLSVNAAPLLDEKGGVTAVVATVDDITDRLRGEAALREEEDRLRFCLETLRAGLWDLDLATHAAYRTLRHDQIFGYEALLPEWTYERFLEHVLPEDRETVDRKFRTAVEARERWDFECRVRRVDGSVAWIHAVGGHRFDARGAPSRMVGIVVDVTERKRAEAALAASEERLRFALDGADDGLWDVRLDTGDFYVSPRGCEILGFTPGELVGAAKAWHELVCPEDLPRTQEALDAYLAGRAPAFAVEQRLRTKTGGWKWVLSRGKVVERDASGRPLRMAGTHKDISDRRRAEEELQRTLERYRSTLDGLLEGGQIIGFDWTYLYLNAAAARHARRPAAELLGRTVTQSWPGIEESALHAAMRRCMEERTAVHMENEFTFPDGSRGHFDLSLQPVPEGIFILSVDVTERKRAEEALHASEARFREMLENVEIVALTLDARGAVTFCNDYLLRLTGFGREEVLGADWFARFVPESDQETHRLFREAALLGGIPSHHENPIRTKGGGTREVLWSNTVLRDPSGRPVGTASLGEDVTDRRRAERDLRALNRELEARVVERTARLEEANAELKRSAEEIRDLYDHAPCGYHSIDEQGRFVQMNATELAWLGYAREEVIGRLRIEDLLTAEGIETFRRSFARLRQEGEARGVVLDVRRKDGSTFPALVSATAVRDEAGRFLMSRTTLFDVTERRKAEERIAQYTAQLQTANRHLQNALDKAETAERVKSAFLAAMSHELRTPLNSVIGFTGALLGGLVGPVSDEQREALEIVRRNGRHLLDLINDVLDLSKIEAGEMRLARQPFDLGAVVSESVRSLAPQAEARGLGLRLEPAPAPIPMVGDARRAAQVVLNLLSNAVKFTERGEVSVRVFVEAETGRAGVAVRDTGPGILASDLDRIFEEFVQVDAGTARSQEGTGLGLALSRKLARLMGGEVAVESARGSGSTFTFRLPLAGGAP